MKHLRSRLYHLPARLPLVCLCDLFSPGSAQCTLPHSSSKPEEGIVLDAESPWAGRGVRRSLCNGEERRSTQTKGCILQSSIFHNNWKFAGVGGVRRMGENKKPTAPDFCLSSEMLHYAWDSVLSCSREEPCFACLLSYALVSTKAPSSHKEEI